jgi:hypothetical protein
MKVPMTKQEIAARILLASKQYNQALGDVIEGYLNGRLRSVHPSLYGRLPPAWQTLLQWALKVEKRRRKNGGEL